MRVNTGIASILLAVFILLAVPCIPHHHHRGKICTTTENCRGNGDNDSRHTGHHDDGSLCLEDEAYLASRTGTPYEDLNPPILPTLASMGNPLVNGDIAPADLRADCYDALATLLQSAMTRTRALRAPPPHLLHSSTGIHYTYITCVPYIYDHVHEYIGTAPHGPTHPTYSFTMNQLSWTWTGKTNSQSTST